MKTPSTFPHINIALFCGGRGSATIIQELLRWPQVYLTLIVNAYDDGLSTGALRGFIPEMLGPSDFRKNLSYLLDLHSEEQYALRNLLEFRLPQTITDHDIAIFKEFSKTEKQDLLIEPLRILFNQLHSALAIQLRHFLTVFFNYAESCYQPFNFCDCSIGNLIFAGAYLEQDNSFNAAAKKLSHLVNSRALLVNVSEGENRILVGLKEDGEFLPNEAKIVGEQSDVPIRRIFLVEKSISTEEWNTVADKSIIEKEIWLHQREKLPQISPEAEKVLNSADIIIYGPGTQHSSLLPSYRIASHALQNSTALVKALVMNLGPDHDIQSFSASDIIDRALSYMNDPDNTNNVITHVLADNDPDGLPGLPIADTYKNAKTIRKTLANGIKKKVHNGAATVQEILSLSQKSALHLQQMPIDIFVDINKRSLAIHSLTEEFIEMDWKKYSSAAYLTINQVSGTNITLPQSPHIFVSNREGTFPEMGHFIDWLKQGKSEYLVLLTGDGEYRFRDTTLAIQLLNQSNLGAVYGSRTQSRKQFKDSIRAAYGEKRFLHAISFIGAFFLSALCALRFGIIFSDPLTGFRIYKRSRMAHLAENMTEKKAKTPMSITKFLISHKIEIAELPVMYRTFSGFTDPYWRIRRGIKNLLSVFI